MKTLPAKAKIVKLSVVKLFWPDDALNFNNAKTMKLKILILFAAIVITFGWPIEAQTNSSVKTPASTNTIYKIVVTTNHVQAASWFREVNGQLYNIRASKFWHQIRVKVYSIQNGGIVAVQYLNNRDGFKHIFLKNYEAGQNGVAKDEMIQPVVMPTGTTNIFYAGNDETFEVWDCGTPHFVDVVATNRVAVRP